MLIKSIDTLMLNCFKLTYVFGSYTKLDKLDILNIKFCSGTVCLYNLKLMRFILVIRCMLQFNAVERNPFLEKNFGLVIISTQIIGPFIS